MGAGGWFLVSLVEGMIQIDSVSTKPEKLLQPGTTDLLPAGALGSKGSIGSETRPRLRRSTPGQSWRIAFEKRDCFGGETILFLAITSHSQQCAFSVVVVVAVFLRASHLPRGGEFLP